MAARSSALSEKKLQDVITQMAIIKCSMFGMCVPSMREGRRQPPVSPSRDGVSLKPVLASDGLYLKVPIHCGSLSSFDIMLIAR